jgi:hypothetical protein
MTTLHTKGPYISLKMRKPEEKSKRKEQEKTDNFLISQKLENQLKLVSPGRIQIAVVGAQPPDLLRELEPESNRRRASSSSPSQDNSVQSTEERARGRDGEMRLRKKERERGRMGFWDVVGGDSPAATGIF